MNNFRGSVLMVVSMAAFALEDALLKSLAGRISTGEILIFVGLGGLLVFWGLLARRGLRLFTSDLRSGLILWRTLGEIIGAIGMVTSLALAPISSVTAILMAAPLFTMMGAALFLREPVGWRRWLAVAIGFAGVLMVIQPGTDQFEPASLFTLVGVCGLVMRDLVTPRLPSHIPSLQVSAAAFAGMLVAGLGLMAIQLSPVQPTGGEFLRILGMVTMGCVGYLAIVTSTRIGELSVVIPLRYSRLVFAMTLGVLFFNERPGPLMLAGAALIVASGLYSIWREAKLRRRAASLARPSSI